MHHFKRYLPLFFIIAAIILLIAALSFYPIEAEDIFSNIASGRYVWEHRTVPTIDPLSYTGPFPWFFDRVLSSVIFFLLHRFGGFPAIIVTTFVILVLSYATIFVFFVKRRIHLIIPFLVLSLIIPASSYWFLTRSYMFGFLLFPLFLVILLSDSSRLRLLLVPLQALWTNLHSSSILGIILVWLDWFFQKNKAWKHLLIPVGVTLVNVVSPVGIQFFSRLWWELAAPHESRANIYEWFSPFHPSIIRQPLVMWFFGAILVTAIFLVLLATKSVHIPKAGLVVSTTLVMLGFSISSARHIPLFYLVLAFLVIFSLSDAAAKLPQGLKTNVSKMMVPGFYAVLTTIGALSVWIFLHGYSNGVNIRRFGLGINEQKFPEAIMTKLLEIKPPGNIFTEYSYGSYFVYKMYPQYKVYIDGGRMDQVYGEEFYQHYIKIGNDRETIKADIAKYTIQAFVLPLPNAPDDVVEIYKYLSTDPGWSLTFFDDHFLVFVDAAVTLKKQIPTFSLLNPLLDLEKALKEKPTLSDTAEAELKQAEQILPDSFNRRALSVIWLWGSNQTPAARAKLDELTHYCDDRDPSATCYLRLVRQLFKYNQLTKALQYTNRIVSWFSPSSGALTLKGDVEAAAGKFDLAKKSYKQGLTVALTTVEQATIAAKLKTVEETKKRFEVTNGN